MKKDDEKASLYSSMKATSKHGLVYGITSSLTFALGIILVPLYTRAFDPTDYGILSLILVTLSLGVAMFSLGINSALLRFYLDPGNTTRAGKARVATTAFVITCGCASLLIGVGFLISPYLSNSLFGESTYWPHFLVMFLGSGLQMVYLIPMTIFRAEERSKRYAVFSIADFLSKLLLTIFLVVNLQMGIMGVIAARTIPTMILTVMAVVCVKDSVFGGLSRPMRDELLRFGIPLVLPEISLTILPSIDKFLLGAFVSLHDVGIFTLATQIAGINWILISSFGLVFGPMRYKMMGRKDALPYFKKTFTYFCIAMMLLSLAITLLSVDGIRIIAGKEYWSAFIFVPLLCFGNALYGLTHSLQLGVVFAKKTYYLGYIILVGIGLNLVLALLLIPSYGIWGAVVTTFITYSMMTYMEYLVNNRFYHVPYEWGRLAVMGVLVLIVLVVGWFLPVGSLSTSLGIEDDLLKTVLLGMTLRGGLVLLLILALWYGPFLEKEERKSIKRLYHEVMERISGT
jgi:O-antigen/teichoic acid export membrane protein